MTSKIKNAKGKSERMAMVRLLRFVGKGPIRLVDGPETIRLCQPMTDASKDVSPVLLHAAVAAGLLCRKADFVEPTSATSAFLKRAMTPEREEIFLEQHRENEAVAVQLNGEWVTAQRNALSSPLQALVRLKDKNGEAYFPVDALEAGERFASDFQRGNLSPRVTASFEPRLSNRVKGQAGGAQEITDVAMAARLRFSRAADAMGPELSGVAIDICCFEKGLEVVERERQWPARSAKLMLRAALQSLARHYAPPETVRKRNSHSWGAEDYRPVFQT